MTGGASHPVLSLAFFRERQLNVRCPEQQGSSRYGFQSGVMDGGRRSYWDRRFLRLFCSLSAHADRSFAIRRLCSLPAYRRAHTSHTRRRCDAYRSYGDWIGIQAAQEVFHPLAHGNGFGIDLYRCLLRRSASFALERSCHHASREHLHDCRSPSQPYLLWTVR